MARLFLETPQHSVSGKVDSLIAAGREGELLDEFKHLPELLAEMRSGDDRLDIAVPIANAGQATGVAVRRSKPGLVDAAIEALLKTYRLGDVHTDVPGDDDLRLFEATAAPLWALGAVAARADDWATLRKVVTPVPVEGGYYETWLRHAQVMEARASSSHDDANVIGLASWQLANHDGYGMKGQTEEERHRALCVFDQLALLVVVGVDWDGERLPHYPSYAKFPESYVEEAIIDLRQEGDLRTAVFPAPDEKLRRVLREVNEVALLQAAHSRKNGWEYRGFQDARTWLFIREGGILEDWQGLS